MTKVRVHRCKSNPHSYDVAIRYDKINVQEWHWVCEQTEFALRKTKQEGVLKKTRTPVSFHIMLIEFCPFCGKRLQ